MDLENSVFYDIDFGLVKKGIIYHKTFSDPHLHQIKKITEHIDSTSIDGRFQVSIDEKECSRVNIRFTPDRPSTLYSAYYKLINNIGQEYNFWLKGVTEDLVVTSSRKFIEIKVKKKGESKLTWFTLNNTSNTLATFQLQPDQNESDITWKPNFGRIQPGESIKIIIKFTPTTNGIRYHLLRCFITNHPPILIEIHTYCQKPEQHVIANKMGFIESIPTPRSTFEYLFEEVDRLSLVCDQEQLVRPPVVLDRYYVYMGSKTLSSGDTIVTATLTATNISSINIHLIWLPDKSGVFQLIPDSMVILRSCKAVFTITFNPSSLDNFFSANLAATLHWGDNFSFVVPYRILLNVIGHSFEEDQFGWLADYKLPRRVLMPPCVPGLPSWSTFMIKRSGHLPLMYRFLLPERSSYRLIPEQGVLTEEFQIIIVKFTAGVTTGIVHRENIRIALNTSIQVDMEIIGTTENPNLWFPKGDKLIFPPTPVNGSLQSYIQAKNVTRHRLKFKLETLQDDMMQCCTSEDFFRPGEQKKLLLSFSPKEVGTHVMTRYLKIWCQDGNSGKIVDNQHLIQFTGSAVHPKLTCVPENLSLGNVHRDEVKTDYIVVRNCGECPCFIKFRIVAKESLSVFTEFKFDPECTTIEPRKDMKIYVTLLADTSGYQSYKIEAGIYKTETFQEEATSMHLLNLNYFCYSYRFRIVDILNLDGDDKVVPKFHLWNILNIDGFNDKMKRSSIEFSDETIEIKIPEHELGGEMMRISFLLENTTDINCTFEVVQCTPCDCPQMTTKTGYVVQRPDYLCPHKSQIYFNPTSQQFEPKKKKALTLIVLFNDATVTLSNFKILLYCSSRPSMKHSLALNITRNILDSNKCSADICCHNINYNTSQISLTSVFIGTACPPLQAIWFYNNCLTDVEYNITFQDDNESFEMVNPKGMIAKTSQHPVLIRFSPLTPKEYKTTLLCKLGSKEHVVLITALGILNQLRNPILISTKMPLISKWTKHVSPVFLDASLLMVNNITTHSTVKRIFLLENITENYFSFEFKPMKIENLISVDVSPKFGTLKPHSDVTISLTITTYYSWFIVTTTLLCLLSMLTYVQYTSKTSIKKRSLMSLGSKQTAKVSVIQSFLEQYDDKIVTIDTTVAMPTYLSISIGVNCTASEWLDKLPAGELMKTGWKSPLPEGPCLHTWSLPPISSQLSHTLNQLFTQIIFDTLESNRCQKELSKRKTPRYYSDVEARSTEKHIPCRVPTTPVIGEVLDKTLLHIIIDHNHQRVLYNM